jgi:hypothetical protein
VHLTESVGLVLVDRNTLTSPLCDIRISYNSSEEWEGHVYFMHPTHNFALIAFDAAPFFKVTLAYFHSNTNPRPL